MRGGLASGGGSSGLGARQRDAFSGTYSYWDTAGAMPGTLP